MLQSVFTNARERLEKDGCLSTPMASDSEQDEEEEEEEDGDGDDEDSE